MNCWQIKNQLRGPDFACWRVWPCIVKAAVTWQPRRVEGGGLSSRHWQNSLIPQQDEILDTCAPLFLSPVKEDSCSINNIPTAPASSAINPPRPGLAGRDSLPISLLKLPVAPPPPLPLTPLFPENSRCPETLLSSQSLRHFLVFSYLSPGSSQTSWIQPGVIIIGGISCFGEGWVCLQ